MLCASVFHTRLSLLSRFVCLSLELVVILFFLFHFNIKSPHFMWMCVCKSLSLCLYFQLYELFVDGMSYCPSLLTPSISFPHSDRLLLNRYNDKPNKMAKKCQDFCGFDNITMEIWQQKPLCDARLLKTHSISGSGFDSGYDWHFHLSFTRSIFLSISVCVSRSFISSPFAIVI